jgi:hypothetical protein
VSLTDPSFVLCASGEIEGTKERRTSTAIMHRRCASFTRRRVWFLTALMWDKRLLMATQFLAGELFFIALFRSSPVFSEGFRRKRCAGDWKRHNASQAWDTKLKLSNDLFQERESE